MLVFSFIALLGVSQAKAEDFFYLEPIAKDRTSDLVLSSSQVTLNVPSATSTNDTWVKMTNIVPQDFIGSYFNFPANLGAQSDLFSIRFADEMTFAKTSTVTVKFPKGNKSSQLYFYNWATLSFEKMDAKQDLASSTFTFDYPKEKHFLMFAILGEPEFKGNASWYVHPKYRGQLIAASTQYPNGTKLKVTNLSNNKEVVVVVRDYGPDPNIHPDRVVDLSKEAFAAIASLSQGVVKVKVTKFD